MGHDSIDLIGIAVRPNERAEVSYHHGHPSASVPALPGGHFQGSNRRQSDPLPSVRGAYRREYRSTYQVRPDASRVWKSGMGEGGGAEAGTGGSSSA